MWLAIEEIEANDFPPVLLLTFGSGQPFLSRNRIYKREMKKTVKDRFHLSRRLRLSLTLSETKYTKEKTDEKIYNFAPAVGLAAPAPRQR
jgi:hypothetical protein